MLCAVLIWTVQQQAGLRGAWNPGLGVGGVTGWVRRAFAGDASGIAPVRIRFNDPGLAGVFRTGRPAVLNAMGATAAFAW